jgi:hypothetical protein
LAADARSFATRTQHCRSSSFDDCQPSYSSAGFSGEGFGAGEDDVDGCAKVSVTLCVDAFVAAKSAPIVTKYGTLTPRSPVQVTPKSSSTLSWLKGTLPIVWGVFFNAVAAASIASTSWV